MADTLADAYDELEAVLQTVRATAGDDLRDLLAARQRAAEAEPGEAHLLPPPEFPGPRFSGAVRWSCRYGCGWSHTERPGLEPMGPLVLPVDLRPEDVSAAITRQAEERHQALQSRVLDAFTAHYAAEHQEQEQ
ncbi:hypothetical protein ACKI16_24060 [Streptomyces scabiei]|uniref:hypothetical protein n=1 Tax=Streptomyces scabiei TaxID=1930 RepID=UPI0038F82115